MSEKVIGMIPARYNSTRFPGKPLADLCGKPMIQRVIERASKAKTLSRLLVATDDERILKTVKEAGGDAVMTPSDLASGTDRIAWVMRHIDADIVINIQGDEPFIEPDEIDQVASILIEDPDVNMGTLVKRIINSAELTSHTTAKVVLDNKGYALYFSRHPIPFVRDSGNDELSEMIQTNLFFKHVGLYSYRRNFLLTYSGWDQTQLEKCEKLEQLRVLENGFKIKTAETKYSTFCVDTPEDAETARKLIKEMKI